MIDDGVPVFNSANWLTKALIISTYYNTDTSRTVRSVSAWFGVSIGMVSESLLIAEHYEEIKNCKTRKEALEMINEANKN